jgi:hypothetical protein
MHVQIPAEILTDAAPVFQRLQQLLQQDWPREGEHFADEDEEGRLRHT